MIVIAYASGQNGMTTWCLEAAYALKENKIDYCLFCDEKINLQHHSSLKTFVIKDDFVLPNRLWGKLKVQIWYRVFRNNPLIAEQIYNILKSDNINASHIIWNNAVYINTNVPIPQSAVAWAYPSHFLSYLKKTKIFAQKQNFKTKLFCYLDSIGFYFSDIKGYKKANSTLAIHNALNKDLQRKKINSFLIYPCIASGISITNTEQNGKLKILIAALNLEESRKGIDWMLNCLTHFEFLNHIEIHLIGNCSAEFKAKYTACLPVTFYGILPRNEVANQMQKMDLFLFGSSLDDWGFVQTEAMSNGLVAISPNLTPFNEIVPLPQLLFELNSKESFLNAIRFVLNNNLEEIKNICLNSINEKFSRKIFAKKITQHILNSTN